jgi:hypothetical protein
MADPILQDDYQQALDRVELAESIIEGLLPYYDVVGRLIDDEELENKLDFYRVTFGRDLRD